MRQRGGGTIQDPLLLLLTNTYFLPMLGRDLGLRTHFVRFLAPRGWGCVVTHCLDTLKRRRALVEYKRLSCIMIWLHNFSGYSCIGITVYKRISCLIIGNLFPSQGINSWLSKSIAQDRWTQYILPPGFKLTELKFFLVTSVLRFCWVNLPTVLYQACFNGLEWHVLVTADE